MNPSIKKRERKRLLGLLAIRQQHLFGCLLERLGCKDETERGRNKMKSSTGRDRPECWRRQVWHACVWWSPQITSKQAWCCPNSCTWYQMFHLTSYSLHFLTRAYIHTKTAIVVVANVAVKISIWTWITDMFWDLRQVSVGTEGDLKTEEETWKSRVHDFYDFYDRKTNFAVTW